MGYHYSDDEIDLIESKYGFWTAQRIAKEIKDRFGRERSSEAVECFANKIGLSAYSNTEDYVSIPSLAREFGITIKGLHALIERRGLKVRRGTRQHYLKLADADALRAEYAPPPWPAIPRKKAETMLGISKIGMYRLLQDAPIEKHYKGKYLYLKAEDVFAEMRRRGLTPPLSYAS